MEGEFEKLLKSLTPSKSLFKVASMKFKDLWDSRGARAAGEAKALKAELAKVDKQVDQLLERILEAKVPSVIQAYENRIQSPEAQKAEIAEKMSETGRPKNTYEGALRTALAFLANPWNLWVSGKLELRKTVMKLVYSELLVYSREDGLERQKLPYHSIW